MAVSELDWLSGADPAALLEHLGAAATDRKRRLFACACARRWWGQLKSYPPQRGAVERAERFAEGDDRGVEEARAAADVAAAAGNAPEFEQFAYLAAAATLAESAADAARMAVEYGRAQAIREVAFTLAPWEDEQAAAAQAAEDELRQQVAILNELFGNPFRPSAVRPHWRTRDVALVAEEIEAEQRFGELPYLADALTDAGCDDEALLRHLRRAEGHLKGCYALDLLLGKQ